MSKQPLRRGIAAAAALICAATLALTAATPASAAPAGGLIPGASRDWLDGTDPTATQTSAYGESVRCADDGRIIGSYPIDGSVTNADGSVTEQAVSWLNIWYSDTCGTNWLQVWNALPAGSATFDVRYTTDLAANGFAGPGTGTYYDQTFGDAGFSTTTQVEAPQHVCLGFAVQAVSTDGSYTSLGYLDLPGVAQEGAYYLIC